MNLLLQCKCIDPDNQGEPEPAACAKVNYKGDGNCDDVNNNKACDYDGGDCCAKSVAKNGAKTGKVKTNFCSEVGFKLSPHDIQFSLLVDSDCCEFVTFTVLPGPVIR